MTALGLAAALPFNQTKGDPLLSLGPVFAIRAKDSVEGEQWALNKGTGGQVLRARYGSVGRAEIRRGIGLITPGTSGNSATIPSSVSLDVSGDFEVMWEGSLDIDTSVNQHLVIRDDQTTGRNWYMTLSGGKCPQLIFWNSAGTIRALTSATGLSISSGQFFALKATVQHDDGGGLTVVKFYTAPSSSGPWVQHGSDVTGSYVAPRNLATGLTEDVAVMVQNSTTLANPSTGGVVKRIWFKNGIDGTSVFDIDFTQQNDFTSSFTCTTGQTVTVTAANAVDTNDPYLSVHRGNDYTYFPGITGNIVTAAWSTSAFTTCSWRMRVRLDSLPGSVLAIAGADSTYGTIQIDTIGRLVVGHRDAATNLIGAQWSTIPVPSLIGNDIWLRCDLDTTTATCTYYYSLDNTNDETLVTWSLVGTPVVGSFAGNTPDPKANILFGSNSVGLAGHPVKMYAGSFYTNGTCKVSWRTVNKVPTLITGSTLTVNRSTSGRKTVEVTQSCWLLGTDDYLEVADNDLLDFNNIDHTVLVITRWWNTAVLYGAVVVKNQTAPFNDGWTLAQNNGSGIFPMYFEDEVGSIDVMGCDNAATQGQLFLFAGIREGTVNKNYVNNTMTSVSAPDVSDLRNSGVMRIGSTPFNAYYADMELFAVYIFRKALTAAEIAAGVQYWNAA